MIDLLIKHLDKDMTEAEINEKDAQGDYKTFMSDAASKCADDSKMLTDKENTMADLQTSQQENGAAKESAFEGLMAVEEYIHIPYGLRLAHQVLRLSTMKSKMASRMRPNHKRCFTRTWKLPKLWS